MTTEASFGTRSDSGLAPTTSSHPMAADAGAPALLQSRSRLSPGLTAPAWTAPASPCGPDERQVIYQRSGIPRERWAEIERMIADAPARPVGKGALDNVVGGLFSSKSLDICPFESHTVERAYLYQLELDTSVVAYRTQVRLHSVEGRDRRGKRYVTSVTADVLVLREDSVTIVECKSLSWLRKQSQKTDVKWFE